MRASPAQQESASALDDHLGYWLRRVSNAVSGAFAQALQAKQTSVAEWVLLRELYERGEATPGDLAAFAGMTKGAVSKVIDKLEAKNWVRMGASANDGRVRVLTLTHAGRASVPVLARLADKNDAHHFECLSARDRAVLRRLLIRIADHNRILDVPTE